MNKDLVGLQEGYAMAGLLVALAIMSVTISMVLPVWSQVSRREREAELIFRGEQYARAVELYQRLFAGAYPPDFESLVKQRFLRQLYKDPMTKDGKFKALYQGQGTTVEPEMRRISVEPSADSYGRRIENIVQDQNGEAQSGVVGVVSKSTDSSIMLYSGRSKYNEWTFVHSPSSIQAGTMPEDSSDSTTEFEPAHYITREPSPKD